MPSTGKLCKLVARRFAAVDDNANNITIWKLNTAGLTDPAPEAVRSRGRDHDKIQWHALNQN